MTIYTDLRGAGIPLDNHESDLYVLDGPTTRAILKRYRAVLGHPFISQVDGRQWLEIPFAYDPFWEAKRRHLRATADEMKGEPT